MTASQRFRRPLYRFGIEEPCEVIRVRFHHWDRVGIEEGSMVLVANDDQPL